MRKIILGMGLLAFVISCEQNETETNLEELQEIQIDMSDFTLSAEADGLTGKSANADEKCHSMQNLAYRLGKNPGLAKKMYDIEYNTRKLIAAKKPAGVGNGGPPGSGGGDPPSIYTTALSIPVVVNILEESIDDVSDAQIESQIAILTADFNNANSNTTANPGGVPDEFMGVIADVEITFTRAIVNRKATSRTDWGTRDDMKFWSKGGIDATDTSTYLNIWVCDIGGGILGYAQFPGGNSATDGVVIGTDYFGETGGVYGHGRTATHEVGHWLNLRHIWGDGRCNRDDYVGDTPKSDRPNFGCPTYPTVHCRSNDMTMNYMDYVYDNCMFMFSEGQDDRMRALFAAGGARESFVQ